MTKFPCSKGFTLLEVMVALGIFAVGAVICLESYLVNMKTVQVMEETETALLMVQRQVEECALVPDTAQAGGGRFPAPHEDYAYDLSFIDIAIGETEKLDFRIGSMVVTGPSTRVEFLVPVLEKAEGRSDQP